MQRLILLVLLPALSLQVPILDKNCTMPAVAPATGDAYAPSATNCDNVQDDAVCAALYTTAVDPAAPAERFQACYGTATTAVIQTFKDAAVASCPKTCGYCCNTPQYSCTNPTPSPLVCSSIVQTQCKDPKWVVQIAQFCPNVCGLCLTGGCVDAVSYCAAQSTICFTSDPNLLAFANTNCAKTCGRCAGGSSTTTSANGLGGLCADTTANCPQWVRNGFCQSTFYTATQKRAYCGTSCGLCVGK